MNSTTLGQLAEIFKLEFEGPAELPLHGLATLEAADGHQLSFFANSKYRASLQRTRAAAVLLRRSDRELYAGPALFAADPYVGFARIAQWWFPRSGKTPGVHPTAVVADDAVVAPTASIGPYCVIESRARISPGAVIGAHCIVGPDCVVGPDCELVARVTLVKRVSLGARVMIHPGAVLGSDGFGLAKEHGRWLKVPQLGGVVVGDDCEIGANTTIDCGALGDTRLADDVRLDNLVQIAHNVEIGEHSAMAGCVGVAGSAKIGRNVLVAGASGIAGHLRIADGTTVLAMSMVTSDINEAGAYGSGVPLMEQRSWQRNMARLRNLDKWVARLGDLERRSETKDKHE